MSQLIMTRNYDTNVVRYSVTTDQYDLGLYYEFEQTLEEDPLDLVESIDSSE